MHENNCEVSRICISNQYLLKSMNGKKQFFCNDVVEQWFPTGGYMSTKILGTAVLDNKSKQLLPLLNVLREFISMQYQLKQCLG